MIKALLELLLLPPTNLIVFALAGLVIASVWPRIGRAMTAVSMIGLLLLSLHAVTTPMLAALELNLPTTPPAGAPPGAIIILSGDSLGSPSVPNGYTVGSMTLTRLRTGVQLHRRTGLPILVSGGPLPRHAPPLADLMTQSLKDDFRVDVKWQEQKSRDTWENARFSAAILLPEGITSVYVVTHAWHMRRALQSFEGTGLTVTAAPTPVLRMMNLYLSDFLPTVGSWTTAYFAAHEWLGAIWYSWR